MKLNDTLNEFFQEPSRLRGLTRFARDLVDGDHQIDAEELTNQAVVDLLRATSGIKTTTPAGIYCLLEKKVHDRFIDWCRKKKRLRFFAQPPDVEDSRGLSLEDARRREIARAAIEDLPPRDRQLVTLQYQEGLPLGEIARRLGLSVETCKKALWRCRENLRSSVKKIYERQ